jgi:pimeloyl-ACP methyl ester carboxylesterase
MLGSSVRSKRLRAALVGAVACLGLTLLTSPARAEFDERFGFLDGFESPGTPADLNRVGILEIGPQSARNVLILNPGTSASAAYFAPLARTIVSRVRGWQVWAVERRENQLEDHSVLDRAKERRATGLELFNYYLGWLVDSSITDHFELIPDEDVGYARAWGMRVAVEDLRRVVERAKSRGAQRIVLGGHSLGGSITTAYATWDFDGELGAEDLDGLVYIDGGSSPTPVTPEQATESLAALETASPWLAFGGIGAPFAGVFNASGSTGALIDPDAPSRGQTFPLLPEDLKPPVRVTNLGQYGYALDTETSPPSLRAAQAHLGRLAESGEPRGWDQAGEITPIERYATMFSGFGLRGLDGTAWYHPQRLTIDSGAVAAGNANPAQAILDVRATHGHELPRGIRIYAFGAALGGQRVLDAARILASQSGIPERNLTLIDRQETYSHNDPNSASPKNEFVDGLVKFLGKVATAGSGRLARRPAGAG